MDLILPNEAKIAWLDALRTNGTVFDQFEVALSAYNGAFDRDTTLADLLADEMAFSGYSRQTFSTWSSPIINADNRASTTGNQLTFTAGAPTGDVFSIFCTNNASDLLYWCGPFPSAIVFGVGVNLYVDVDVLLASIFAN